MIYQTQPVVFQDSLRMLLVLSLAISNHRLLETQINKEPSKVLTWCDANKLNINPSKSN